MKTKQESRLSGQVGGDGNQGRAVGIGRFIRYHSDPDSGIKLKCQHETLVENRASGDRLFLQFAVKLR